MCEVVLTSIKILRSPIYRNSLYMCVRYAPKSYVMSISTLTVHIICTRKGVLPTPAVTWEPFPLKHCWIRPDRWHCRRIF